jgi:glycosyltransferase involved in cell wall biosynthesis
MSEKPATVETPIRDLPSMVSVVVPVLDCEELIKTQLDALAEQDYKGDWEVLVVDNGSTDNTVEVAKAYSDRLPNLRIVDASSRRGVSHARNCGARTADGEVILICDADDRVRKTWVRKMAEASRRFDLIGGYLDTKSLNDVETRSWRNPFSPSALPVGMLEHLPFAVGANVGVTRDCFEALDGWREEYICGGDDVDFSWRAQQAGFRLGMAPGAVIDYRYRTGLSGLWRQFVGYGMADPLIYVNHRARGMPRPDTQAALKAWLRLAARSPLVLTTRRRRGLWIRNFAFRWGRLRGSIRYRCLYL